MSLSFINTSHQLICIRLFFVFFHSGSEDFLQPLCEARDLMERLAMEVLSLASSAEKTCDLIRGPLLGRMELICQLFCNGMHSAPLDLGELAVS